MTVAVAVGVTVPLSPLYAACSKACTRTWYSPAASAGGNATSTAPTLASTLSTNTDAPVPVAPRRTSTTTDEAGAKRPCHATDSDRPAVHVAPATAGRATANASTSTATVTPPGTCRELKDKVSVYRPGGSRSRSSVASVLLAASVALKASPMGSLAVVSTAQACCSDAPVGSGLPGYSDAAVRAVLGLPALASTAMRPATQSGPCWHAYVTIWSACSTNGGDAECSAGAAGTTSRLMPAGSVTFTSSTVPATPGTLPGDIRCPMSAERAHRPTLARPSVV